ncbi:MAG: hypothetical protein LBC08_02600, partial [Campylobacteraceae bacterium]|nr:hypothetical protein [Campylobacteraceae bacterium]
MRLFRDHFSVVFSLFVLLCSLQFVVFINKIIKEYESYLVNDYSIVVSSRNALNKEELMRYKPIIKSIEEIDTATILERFKRDAAFSYMQNLK